MGWAQKVTLAGAMGWAAIIAPDSPAQTASPRPEMPAKLKEQMQKIAGFHYANDKNRPLNELSANEVKERFAQIPGMSSAPVLVNIVSAEAGAPYNEAALPYLQTYALQAGLTKLNTKVYLENYDLIMAFFDKCADYVRQGKNDKKTAAELKDLRDMVEVRTRINTDAGVSR